MRNINNKLGQERADLLQQLLKQAQTTNNLKHQESVVNQIAALVLRSRPLCRRFNGMPLTGVYQEIYDQVKQQLINHIKHQLTQKTINSKQIKPNYLYAMQVQIFKQILDDNYLKKLGLSAQSYLINSELRAYALTELIKAIKLSERLCRPHINKFSHSLYLMLYEEALAETLVYVCLNIDLYDPNRGNKKFINWVNFKLDKFLLKCYGQHSKYTEHHLPSFDDLDQVSQPSVSFNLPQLLSQYIEQDPKQIFAKTHIRNRPDVNFSRIALAKFAAQSWSDISQEVDIPIATLSSFYNRWCHRFTPLLEAELKKYI